MIYFILCHTQVKIGYTRDNPEIRLKQLQTGNPIKLELLKVIKGDVVMEKKLHYKFKDSRTNGEWFKYSEEIKQYLKKHKGVVLKDIEKEYSGHKPHTVRWDDTVMEMINIYMNKYDCNKSEAVRALISLGSTFLIE